MAARPLLGPRPLRRAQDAPGGASGGPFRVEQRMLYEYASPRWTPAHRDTDYEQALGVAQSLSRGPFGRGLDDVVLRVTAGAGKRPVYFYKGDPIDGSQTTLEAITAQFQNAQRSKPWLVWELNLARPGDAWRLMEGADTRDLARSRAGTLSRGLFSFMFRVSRARDGATVARFVDGRPVRASTLEARR